MPSGARLTFEELVKECGGKKGAIITGDDYDGNGAEFEPYDDDDADCFCDWFISKANGEYYLL